MSGCLSVCMYVHVYVRVYVCGEWYSVASVPRPASDLRSPLSVYQSHNMSHTHALTLTLMWVLAPRFTPMSLPTHSPLHSHPCA